VLDHNLEQGNPPDAPQLAPAVERIIKRTGRKPGTATADRGYGQKSVDDALHDLGVRHVVIPRKGKPGKARQAEEHRPAFRKTVKWRTGSEGRISSLKRIRVQRRRNFPARDHAWHTLGMATQTTGEVRTWAKQQGIAVSDRGRLPASLLEAYRTASSEQAASSTQNTKEAKTRPSKNTSPSSPGRRRRKDAASAKAPTGAPGSGDQDLFGDKQSVLRRLSALEGHVADLLGRLETAGRALDQAHNSH